MIQNLDGYAWYAHKGVSKVSIRLDGTQDLQDFKKVYDGCAVRSVMYADICIYIYSICVHVSVHIIPYPTPPLPDSLL